MACTSDVLKEIPLFGLLDEDERAILAAQVDLREFKPNQRIYKAGDPAGGAFIMVRGSVAVATIDEDNQVVVLHTPSHGEAFGLAAMLSGTAHTTSATAIEQTQCLEIRPDDLHELIRRKPDAAVDLMGAMARQFHAAENVVRVRATRNPNELIEQAETFGERVADRVASFGGSWAFIIAFSVVLSVYTAINLELGSKAWDPYPFILLNLFLSMLAAIQAPVIMMSQNRQDKKDRLRSELDFDVNRHAHTEIQGLAHRMNLLHDKIDDITDWMRRDVR